MIWRRLQDPTVPQARALVDRWFYFRSVGADEAKLCDWFALMEAGQPRGLLWIHPVPANPELDLRSTDGAAHACTDPAHRGRLSEPAIMAQVEFLAGLEGYDRVLSVLDFDAWEGPDRRVIRRWLRMRGWREHPLGMVREIGG